MYALAVTLDYPCLPLPDVKLLKTSVDLAVCRGNYLIYIAGF